MICPKCGSHDVGELDDGIRHYCVTCGYILDDLPITIFAGHSKDAIMPSSMRHDVIIDPEEHKKGVKK